MRSGAPTGPTRRTPSIERSRWAVLDGVRGAAVVAVVVYHVFRLVSAGEGSRDAGGLPVQLWPLGTARLALDVFFVLSGLLVVRSWTALRRRCARGVAMREFAWRRATRVLPAYWLLLAVLVPLTAPELLDDSRRLALLVSVNQYLEPQLPAKVNTVVWSLTTEWHFYVLVPLLASLMLRFRSWKVLVACIALAVWWWRSSRGGLPASLLPGRLDEFVAGAAAGDLVRRHAAGEPLTVVRMLQARAVGPALGAAFLALGIYQGSTLGMARGRLVDVLVHPAAGLIAAAAFVRLLTADRGSVLECPTLRRIGTISYSLYLWHYPVLLHGLRWARSWGWATTPAATGVVAVAALVPVSVAVALVSFILAERPFLARPRRKYDSTGVSDVGVRPVEESTEAPLRAELQRAAVP